jgi:hypothetical protein
VQSLLSLQRIRNLKLGLQQETIMRQPHERLFQQRYKMRFLLALRLSFCYPPDRDILGAESQKARRKHQHNQKAANDRRVIIAETEARAEGAEPASSTSSLKAKQRRRNEQEILGA